MRKRINIVLSVFFPPSLCVRVSFGLVLRMLTLGAIIVIGLYMRVSSNIFDIL